MSYDYFLIERCVVIQGCVVNWISDIYMEEEDW